MLECYFHSHHTALRCAQKAHRTQPHAIEDFCCILCHLLYGIFRWQLISTFHYIDCKILLSAKSMDYAYGIYEFLRNAGIRVELDDRNEKIGYKIRSARQEDKVPYMIIVGEKEVSEDTISVRDRATDQTNTCSLEQFSARLREEICRHNR